VQRINQRQGFLVSAVIHLTFLMMLLTMKPSARNPTDLTASELESRQVVMLPPPAVLRQLAPAPPAAARPRPVPTPAAPDPTKKDRISIGPPSEVRREGPMILRRDDDLTKAARGEPTSRQPQDTAPTPAPTPAPRVAESRPEPPEGSGREGLRLPPGLVGPPAPRGEDGSRRREGSISSSVGEAIDDVSRRVAQQSPFGIPTGTGQSVEGLRFDPRGADFTVWINHFKNEVYRNWIAPQAAYFYAGHVDFEFTVERDGSVSSLRMLKSSGTVSLDRAARNALTYSRFMALPNDYGPPSVTMQVTFYYNEAPQGS